MTRSHSRRPARTLLLESLEDRVVPAINIEVNYSLDTGFFKNNPAAVTVFNTVAEQMGERVSANLAAIDPSGVNTWTASFYSPSTGALTSVVNLNVAANTIVVYVGAHAMSGGEVGYGATGGYSWSGYQSFANSIDTRNWSGFVADNGGIWGGSIQFATNANWYFGLNPAGLQSNQVDFYSVATHELGHVLGAGTSPQWMPNVKGLDFYGPHSMAVYGGPVPLASSSDLGEWQSGLTYNGQPVSENPVFPYGSRINWTPLDEAALEDVGWNAGVTVSPPVSPPPVSPPPVSPPPVVVSPPPASPPVSPPPVVSPPPSPPVVTSPPVSPISPLPVPVLASATGAGVPTLVSVKYSNGTTNSWYPFGSSFTGGATVVLGDLAGNGIPDIIVASGPSTTLAGTIAVYNGSTRSLIETEQPLGHFSGGLAVATGDVNDDGHADIVVGAESAGPPIVTVINGLTGVVMSQFLAYSTQYQGGVRVSAGNVSGNGYADVVVSPGYYSQGLPVEVYSGQSLASGGHQLLTTLNPFPNYTGALSVAVGNLTPGGYADIVVGTLYSADAIAVYSGAAIASQAPNSLLFKQTAWNSNDNAGIRVSMAADSSNDGLDDLIITNRTGTMTARLLAPEMTSTGWSPADDEFFTAMVGVNSSVFIS